MKSLTIPGSASSSAQLQGGFPSFSSLQHGGTGDQITDLLTLRFGSRIDEGELNRLALKQAQLKDWKNKIMTVRQLQDAVRQGRLPLGLRAPEGLRQLCFMDFGGKPEQYYKQMLEEAVPILDDYRAKREMTGRYYGSSDSMEQVWT